VVSRAGERGGALLLALAVVAIAALAIGTALGGLQQETEAVRRAETRARVNALVDAAIAATLARLAEDELDDGLPAERFGGGEIASRVEPRGDGTAVVEVSASAGGRSATTRLLVRLDRSGATVLRRLDDGAIAVDDGAAADRRRPRR
jgi:type II secretory pathway component PulK